MKQSYLVGLLCGGLMEDPEFHVSGPYLLIDSESEDEACDIYNEKTNASYFYGHVLASVDKTGNFNILSDYISRSKCRSILQSLMKQ